MRDCIEEGILQSYIDNELSPDMAKRVAAHIATCRACADALNEASAETEMFATALEAEMALAVPTVRLRQRIDAAIAEIDRPVQVSERKPKLSLGAWLSSLAASFKLSPQRAVGFASLIAVIAFAAIFAVMKLQRPTVTTNNAPEFVADSGKRPDAPKTNPSPTPAPPDSSTPTPDNNKGPKDAPSQNNKPKKQSKPNLTPEPDQLPRDELAGTRKLLPGEENYLRAIDSLATEIAESGEANMKPSLRAEYERNLAVVDQAIDSTRRVARRNPRDADAAQFLYSSYQSKLDLLSAVAQQVRPVIATR